MREHVFFLVFYGFEKAQNGHCCLMCAYFSSFKHLSSFYFLKLHWNWSFWQIGFVDQGMTRGKVKRTGFNQINKTIWQPTAVDMGMHCIKHMQAQACSPPVVDFCTSRICIFMEKEQSKMTVDKWLWPTDASLELKDERSCWSGWIFSGILELSVGGGGSGQRGQDQERPGRTTEHTPLMVLLLVQAGQGGSLKTSAVFSSP